MAKSLKKQFRQLGKEWIYTFLTISRINHLESHKKHFLQFFHMETATFTVFWLSINSTAATHFLQAKLWCTNNN